MSTVEIELAQHYLARSDQDPVTALIRSVRDLAKLRRLLAGSGDEILSAAVSDGPDRRPAVARGASLR